MPMRPSRSPVLRAAFAAVAVFAVAGLVSPAAAQMGIRRGTSGADRVNSGNSIPSPNRDAANRTRSFDRPSIPDSTRRAFDPRMATDPSRFGDTSGFVAPDLDYSNIEYAGQIIRSGNRLPLSYPYNRIGRYRPAPGGLRFTAVVGDDDSNFRLRIRYSPLFGYPLGYPRQIRRVTQTGFFYGPGWYTSTSGGGTYYFEDAGITVRSPYGVVPGTLFDDFVPIDGFYIPQSNLGRQPLRRPPEPPTIRFEDLPAGEQATLLLVWGEYEQAIDAYREHLRDNPEDADAFRAAGLALLAERKFVEGIAAVREAYRLDPTLATTPVPESLLGADDTRRTLSWLVTRNHRSDLPSGWLAAAVLMQARGQADAALRMLDKAAELGVEAEILNALRSALDPSFVVPRAGAPAAADASARSSQLPD